MGQNELGITRLFYDALREMAESSGKCFQSFPLGGQDRKMLSDELLATLNHFALVEMKHSNAQLSSEREKYDRVVRLCTGLEGNNHMRQLHDICHWIGYQNNMQRLAASPYRHQICNRTVLGENCPLQENAPNDCNTVTVKTLGERFFGLKAPPLGLDTAAFKTYLTWLLKVVTTEEGEFYVLARNKDSDGEIITVEFSSLEEINSWFIKQIPTPKDPSDDQGHKQHTCKPT